MGKRWTWGGIATLVGCALVLFVFPRRSGEHEGADLRSDDRADATLDPAAHDTVTLRGAPKETCASPVPEAQDAADDVPSRAAFSSLAEVHVHRRDDVA